MSDSDEHATQPLSEVESSLASRKPMLAARGADIVVIDDCSVSLLVATRFLEHGGYRARGFLEVPAAQKAILAETPDLVLVDLNMPEMSGLDMCDWVKNEASTRDVPVLFISGETRRQHKAEAFRRGGADFILKPIDAEELLLRVELHLQLSMQRRELLQSLQERNQVVEARLQWSNAELLKLYAAVEQSPASVVITDRNGTIEYVNQKFTETSGYTLDEVRGQTPRVLRCSDTPRKVYQEMWQTILDGGTWQGTLRNRRKDGRTYWEQMHIAPVRAEDGDAITHFIALKEDITAQREIEAQLRQAQKLEAIGRLAAGIAHEINTPTQFVSDNLFFLRTAFADLVGLLEEYRNALAILRDIPEQASLVEQLHHAEQKSDIDYVKENAPGAFESSADGIKRISTIVRAMKEFSHPDQHEMEAADLNSAIENTLTISRNEYKYVADLEKSLGPVPPVMCHIGDVCQAILNIVVNAAHAIGDVYQTTGKRGTIRVRSSTEPGFVRIEIEDTGMGIPEQDRDRVFEPFFTTKEIGKGTGQGLAIARATIVQKHKGTLSFTTEMGKGTVFLIRLPMRPVEPDSGKVTSAGKTTSTASPATASTPATQAGDGT
jgi:PAS domain S-box-containing protein